jgi:uncharacterized protein YydD (DUF2326 family)
VLRELSSALRTFKTLEFHGGLNILVADKTLDSAETDTRNGSGKSSVVELLHFLLGGRADKNSLPLKPELREYEFSLDLDWPVSESSERFPITVSRSGVARERVTLNPDPRWAGRFLLPQASTISNSEWQATIEADLFQLTGDHPCVSGRSMLSYYMRRASAHAFNTATRHFPMQSSTDMAGNLCYLFGLNWHIAADYREIADKEELRRKLKQAAKDPMLGRIVGNAAELRSQVAVAEQRTMLLERQLDEFQVVPEYERLKAEADRITAQVRSETDADVIDKQNLTQLEEAIAEERPLDSEYVERAYAELRIDIPDGVRRSYTAVKDFHDSVVRNRKYYLESEIQATTERIAARRVRLQELDARRANIMQTLKRGGALESFLSLQKVLARDQANVEVLRSRFEAAEALEATDRQIRARRVELQGQMSVDLAERSRAVNTAAVTYAEYARALYGEDRQAYLVISADEGGVRFSPHIESDDSQGISSMVIFCFDLTMAVMARRAGVGPDFLVHDSHLFDGVDARQIARALQLATRVARKEGIQYIATMNSDDLQKAIDHGFDPAGHVLPVRLTDARDDGGLFGFRFP